MSDGTDSSSQSWDKLLKGFWFLTCIQQQFSTLRYVTWVEYKQNLTCLVPDVWRLCPLCLITEQPMVNLKGLYNIMQLSRCLLTHYRRTHQWQLVFLLPNVDFFFWKWVSHKGHALEQFLKWGTQVMWMWLCSHTHTLCHNLVEIEKQHKISYFLLCKSQKIIYTGIEYILYQCR